MKDSEVEWLGEVPEHWRIERAKWLYRKVERPVRDADEVVTCFRDGTVTLRRNRRRSGFTESLKEIGYQGIRRGDLVIHAMDAFAGAIGVSDSNGKGTPVYAVCEAGDSANPHYHATALREMARAQWIVALSTGVRERSTDFRHGTFADQLLPVPPLREQTAIVRYLDHVDGRIGRVVRARERLIELLTEQKQALIHQAVTGGIDVRTGEPYPAYKDSGVEWLGEVPEHWDMQRLKDASVVQTGLTLGKSYKGQETRPYPYLRVANVQVGRVDLADVKNVDVPAVEATTTLLRIGDVLMTEGGDIDKLGRGCVWDGGVDGCLHQNHIFAVRCNTNLLEPQFLVRIMGSQHGRSYFQTTAKQTTNLASTNKATLLAFPIPVPSVAEQRAIVEWTRDAARELEGLQDRARCEIELLKEYRTRLIADVVTGKLDVRAAAANLPDDDPAADAADAVHHADGDADDRQHAADDAAADRRQAATGR